MTSSNFYSAAKAQAKPQLLRVSYWKHYIGSFQEPSGARYYLAMVFLSSACRLKARRSCSLRCCSRPCSALRSAAGKHVPRKPLFSRVFQEQEDAAPGRNSGAP